jgi:hypothetical protein
MIYKYQELVIVLPSLVMLLKNIFSGRQHE